MNYKNVNILGEKVDGDVSSNSKLLKRKCPMSELRKILSTLYSESSQGLGTE